MHRFQFHLGGLNLQIAGDRTFEPWNITVINDTDFNVRNSFEEWMNGINQHEENTGLTQPSSYMADMVVEQLDKDGSVKNTMIFVVHFQLL